MVSKVLPAPSFSVVQRQLTKVAHLTLGLASATLIESTHRHLVFARVIRNDMVTEAFEVQRQLSVEKVYRDPLHNDEVNIYNHRVLRTKQKSQ